MKTNNFTMNFNAPVGEVKPLQTKTESILARMNADYEAGRAKIRRKIGEERCRIDAIDVIRAQHKKNIRQLTNKEDALRVKWMEEKAKVLEETESNRIKRASFYNRLHDTATT